MKNFVFICSLTCMNVFFPAVLQTFMLTLLAFATFDLIDKFGIGNNTIHGLETLPSCGTTPRSSCQCQLMFANLLGFFFSFFFAVYTLGRIPLFNPIDCLRLVDVGSSSYSFLC